MKKYLGVALSRMLYHLCKCCQFYPNPICVTPLRSVGMNVRRVASIWNIMMNPHDINMEDISNVFSYTVSRVSNVRYFKYQEFAFEHVDEEQRITMTCCDGFVICLDLNRRDLEEK